MIDTILGLKRIWMMKLSVYLIWILFLIEIVGLDLDLKKTNPFYSPPEFCHYFRREQCTFATSLLVWFHSLCFLTSIRFTWWMRFFIYLFVNRHEVHSINTHTLHNAGRWKQTNQNVLQGIGAGGITGLPTLFAIALKAIQQVYRHIVNTSVCWHVTLATTLLRNRAAIPKLVE